METCLPAADMTKTKSHAMKDVDDIVAERGIIMVVVLLCKHQHTVCATTSI